MSCELVRQLAQDYVTRELDPDMRRLMDEHLLECEDCRRELALMSAVVSELEAMPLEEPAPGFSTRVLAALPRRRQRLSSPAWAVVPALVLAVLTWFFRQELTAGLSRILGWFGIDLGRAALPALTVPTVPQFLLLAAAVGLAAVGFTVAAAVLTWRRASE